LNSGLGRLRGIGIAAAIAIVAAAIQGVRLPAVLDGPTFPVALGSASDPHLLVRFLDSSLLQHCALSAPCIHGLNLTIFALSIFVIGAFASTRGLGLLATAILAMSPLAVAAIVDPLGASLSLGLVLVTMAAIDVAGVRTFATVPRCALAIALALVDPALAPVAIAYGAFGGFVPLACALAASGIRFFLQHPILDPLAAPATLVAFGFCTFVGGPLLMLAVRHRAFRWLDDDGTALLRAGALAAAALAGGLFAGSGDVAPYWLDGEAAVLVGLVAGLSPAIGPKAFERATIAFMGLLVLQFGLFIQHHGDVTTAAIAFRGDDLRGMLAASPESACVASDAVADRYTLAGGAFLHLYPPLVAPKMVRDPAACMTMPDSTTVVTMTGLAVNNWGNAVPLMKAYRDASDPAGTLQIEGGAVTPATKANTPTGRGEFGNEIDTPLGHVGDFTIVTGYAYAPQCLPVTSGKRLRFSAASIPGTPALRIRISATSGGVTHELLNAPFAASKRDAPYEWHRYELPVAPSDCASFTLAVAKMGAASTFWVTFAGASIR
jgi:hypothetical protein